MREFVHLVRSVLGTGLFRVLVPLFAVLWIPGVVFQERWKLTEVCSYLPALGVSLACLAFLAGRGNLRHRRRAYFCAVMALTTMVKAVAVDFAWNPAPAPPPATVRFVHWNVVHAPFGAEVVLRELEKVAPDVCVLSEFTLQRDLNKAAKDWLYARTGGTGKVYRTGNMILLSSLPVKAFRRVPIPHGSAFRATIQGGHGEFDIMGIDFSSDPKESRRPRAKLLARDIRMMNPRRPILVAGDFNTPRDSSQLDPLRKICRNAFEEVGRGWPYSWPLVPLPVFSIDQIWFNKYLRMHSYELRPVWCSDHLMQVCEFSTPKQRNRRR